MRKPPLVSVVIPAYNSAATIAEALHSVEAQTFRDFEVIVVDDASTDDTVATAHTAFSTPDTRHPTPDRQIITLSRNRGPAAARNRGIAEARGEWIAFLDGDDAWLPWRLEAQFRCAAEYPAVALFCGETADLTSSNDEPPPSTVHGLRSTVLRLQDLAIRNCVATSTVLVRKEAVLSVGGFDEQFRGPEDFDLWLRILVGHPARKLACPLSQYRHVPGSLSMNDRKFLPEVLRVLDKAYGPGGALAGVPARGRAVAFQYLCASWMAADRRDAARAWGLYLKGLALWPRSFRPYLDLPGQRMKLFVGLVRRLAGRT